MFMHIKCDPLMLIAINQQLAQALHSTLISTYLDCAPAVFSPSASPSETEVNLVVAVAEIARTLYGVLLQASHSVGSYTVL